MKKRIEFLCTPKIFKQLQDIADKRKADGEQCSVSELLRKGAIHIIKKDKEKGNED